MSSAGVATRRGARRGNADGTSEMARRWRRKAGKQRAAGRAVRGRSRRQRQRAGRRQHILRGAAPETGRSRSGGSGLRRQKASFSFAQRMGGGRGRAFVTRQTRSIRPAAETYAASGRQHGDGGGEETEATSSRNGIAYKREARQSAHRFARNACCPSAARGGRHGRRQQWHICALAYQACGGAALSRKRHFCGSMPCVATLARPYKTRRQATLRGRRQHRFHAPRRWCA